MIFKIAALLSLVMFPLSSIAAPPPAEQASMEHGRGFEKENKVRELIKEIPAHPVYPNATLESSYRKSEGERSGFEAKYTTGDPVITVARYYEKAFVEQGWKLTRPIEDPLSTEIGLEFEKSHRKLLIAIEREGDETEIVIEIPMHRVTLNTGG